MTLTKLFEQFLIEYTFTRQGETCHLSEGSKRLYRVKLSGFLSEHGDKDIGIITPRDITICFAEMREKGYSDGNLAFHRSRFRTFFKWAAQLRDDGVNIAHGIRPYSAVPKRVTTASMIDVIKCLEACEALSLVGNDRDKRAAAIFVFGVTGARRSNIMSASLGEALTGLRSPSYIDGKLTYTIFLDRGKSPFAAVLDESRAEIVRRYIKIRPKTEHDKLFVNLSFSSSQQGTHGDPLGKSGMGKARMLICKAAGVELISFKKLRCLFGSEIAREYGIQVAAVALGHNTVSGSVVVDHYYDPDKERAKMAAVNFLPTGDRKEQQVTEWDNVSKKHWA